MNEWVQGLNELMRRLLVLPEQASTFAIRIDRLHYFVFIVTMVSSVGVGLASVYFFFRYRERQKNASTPKVVPSVRFETIVIAIPLFFFLVWVYVGFRDYIWYTNTPKGAMDVYVTGKKWMWHFAHPDGPNANATLTVPAHRPVRLLMTSRDVIHSFFVPAVPDQAGRDPRSLHRDLVRGDQGRALSHLLHGVLRYLALPDGG